MTVIPYPKLKEIVSEMLDQLRTRRKGSLSIQIVQYQDKDRYIIQAHFDRDYLTDPPQKNILVETI